jgi:hypothetical protein
MYTDSLCAQVAEVTVKPNGQLKVNRVTVVLDTRYMVNPRTIAEQVESAVMFGLTAALYGKITIKDGAAAQDNFDPYRMVRLAEAPKIEVHLLPGGGVSIWAKPRGFERGNAWEDVEFVMAVKMTGRKKLIMTALWTEACLTHFAGARCVERRLRGLSNCRRRGGTSDEAHRAASEPPADVQRRCHGRPLW